MSIPISISRIVPVALFLISAGLAFQAGQKTGANFLGPQLIRAGRLEDALSVYQQAAEASPKSVPANNGAGVVLDLLGRYTEARKYLSQATKISTMPAKWLTELGRLCLDADDTDRAYRWYERGHEAGMETPNIRREFEDLWDFRWAHARARIAARRGKRKEARKHVATARAILAKGTNPAQEMYFPYLTGYVAFYAGDYQAALACRPLLRAPSQRQSWRKC